MNNDPVRLALLTERDLVNAAETSELDVVVEVRGEATGDRPQSATAMNLCVVIDRSRSMAGQKLEDAKRSCLEFSRRLGGRDLFTVVVFDDDAQVVVNPQTPRAEVAERIQAIRAGRMTNLSLGWYLGLLELQSHMTEAHHSRLFLLSDGAANAGETKRAALAATASKGRDAGITTSTIGIGHDFQEDLLDAIATSSGGRFWYIGESGIEKILNEEFQGALTVVLDRPRVELVLPPGVRLRKNLNPFRQVSRRYLLRPLQGQDTIDLAVRLEVEPAEVGGEEFTLGAVLYDGDRAVTSTEQRVALAPLAQVVLSQSHPLVASIVQQYEMASTDEAALDELAAGNIAAMREMLQAEVARMRSHQDAMGAAMDATQGDHAARFLMELRSTASDMMTKEVSLTIADLVAPYVGTPEVDDFLSPWRKGMVHEVNRMRSSRKTLKDADRDMLTGLVVAAVALACDLIRRDPARTEELTQIRERLRGYLARIEQQ